MSRKILYGMAAGAAMFFTACGGDTVTEVTEVKETGMTVLDKGEKMPKCNDDSEGDMVYALDSAAAYICVNKKWASLNGKDGADGKDGEPGAQGKKGDKGDKGEDGASCTAEVLADSSGYKIICGGDSVGVVLNGEKGEKGDKGDAGGKEGSDVEVLFIDESVYDSTGNTLTDLRDGKVYRTTTIGDQVWMAENLNFLYYFKAKDGSAVVPSYCYNDTASYCEKYGRLYKWGAAMDSAAVFSDDGKGCGQFSECEVSGPVRGVCPKGWHLPSEKEFNTLTDAVGGRAVAGDALKSTSGWVDPEKGTVGNGTDDYGFTVLPGGFRDVSDGAPDYRTLGELALFWTSTLSDKNDYLVATVDFWVGSSGAVYATGYMWQALSVRCLMD